MSDRKNSPQRSSKEVEPIELIEPLWEQQIGESSDWYRRFCRIRNQVGKRSVLSAYRAETEEKASNGMKQPPLARQIPGSWKTAQRRYRWEERFEAWDKYQQEKEDQIWDVRFNRSRERAWEYVELLFQKAEPMIRMPIVKQTVTARDDGKVILNTIEATDWRQFLVPLKMVVDTFDLSQKVIGNLNVAATLLDKAGFTVEDPTILKSAEDGQMLQDKLEFLDPLAGYIPPVQTEEGRSPSSEKDSTPDQPDSEN